MLGPSIEERMRRGKALRESVPRNSHAKWSAPPNSPDPIEILRQSDRGRLPDLLPIRYGRMRQSPFAFFRGSAAVMAWTVSLPFGSTVGSVRPMRNPGREMTSNQGSFFNKEAKLLAGL